jgi:hypothetical protein
MLSSMTSVEQAAAVAGRGTRRRLARYGGLAALLLYGCLNALLYASLMPLWEGFDEPFHYGYVQSLSRWHALPILGRTPLPAEVSESLDLAPASYIVKFNLPKVRTFSEYFALPAAERRMLRQRLDSLKGDRPPGALDGSNYEAQQPPLAYALLAPADRLWADVPLPARIWRLRLLAAFSAVLATGAFTWLLARQLSLGSPWPEVAVFLVLSSQMFYASTAHIANDWLAVSLMAAFAWAAVRFARRPAPWRAAALGLILAAGLLAKASFLALLPAGIALLAVKIARRSDSGPVAQRARASGPVPLGGIRGRLARVCPYQLATAVAFAAALLPAVPWYARNLVLYHRLTGLLEPRGGVGLAVMLRAAWQVDWWRANAVLVRSSFWMGNNSNLMLSGATVDAMLVLLAMGGLLYLWRVRRRRGLAAEAPILAAVACFLAGLAYATVLNFIQCEGVATSAAPWYAFGVVPWLACLLLLGLAEGRTLGRLLAALTVLLWAYVMGITFWLKLIPLYAGYAGRVNPGPLLAWYRRSGPLIGERLRDVSLIGPAGIYWLAALAALTSLALAALLVRRLWIANSGARC